MPETHYWTAAVLALALMAGPTALAQTVEDQAREAGAHADALAGQASEDPRGFAENATEPSWQSSQVNWTLAWSCATAYAVDEQAGAAAEEATGCPAPEDATASEDDDPEEEDDARAQADEANQTRAEAEEAQADAETAARDGAAAAEAFANATANDPENATHHAFTLVNRTLAILERLLSLPLAGLHATHAAAGVIGDAVGDAVHDAQRVVTTSVETTAAGVALAAHGLADGVHGLADGIHAAGEAAGGASRMLADAVEATARATVDGVRDLVGSMGAEDRPADARDLPTGTSEVGSTPDGVVEDVPSLTGT